MAVVAPVTLYDLKPRFQALLRPLARRIFEMGGTANQVTVTAAAGSILVGLLACYEWPNHPAIFLLVPLWLFVRMALNAIDGKLAREFGQQSTLGMFLNELCDVVSDAALILPFSLVAPFSPAQTVIVALLAALTEFAGALGAIAGASRRYDGPLGKSDRALVLGGLGLWLGLAGGLPSWLYWLMPTLVVLLAITIVNRVRAALNEVADARERKS